MQSESGEVAKSGPEAEPKPPLSGSERFRNIALGIAGVISSVLIPILGLYYTSRDKDREVSKGFVELATKILSDNPTESNKSLREWAVSLIDNYSAVRLPEEARTSLLNKQPIFETTLVQPMGPNVEAAVISEFVCPGGKRYWIYRYTERPPGDATFNVILPPNWGQPIGGHGLFTLQDAEKVVSDACNSKG